MTVRRLLFSCLATLALLAFSGGVEAGPGSWEPEILLASDAAPALRSAPVATVRKLASPPDAPEEPPAPPSPPPVRLLIHRFNE
jgi:hypothetical protein